jgi:hypothetical protein
VDSVLCDLVAHHTGAAVEAEKREIASELEEFGPPERHHELLDVLTAADMTTSPEGEKIAPEARVNETFSRYGPDDAVRRAVTRSGQGLIRVAHRMLDE